MPTMFSPGQKVTLTPYACQLLGDPGRYTGTVIGTRQVREGKAVIVVRWEDGQEQHLLNKYLRIVH